jgi:hypothetical protein
VFFYADDGLLSAHNKNWVQNSFDILRRSFERVGLWSQEISQKENR